MPGMANTSSAKKAARQAVKRTQINQSRHSRLKTTVRSVEEAIGAGKKADAEAAEGYHPQACSLAEGFPVDGACQSDDSLGCRDDIKAPAS
jgi:hypothetical protein